METPLIRHAVVAGQFYPANPDVLSSELETFLSSGTTLEASDSAISEKESALLTLLPHAGYVYCGKVIGATLSRVRLPRRLVLLGPNHTGVGAELAVWPEGVWETPLGKVPVDAELASCLITSQSGYTADTRAHQSEHSLEVLLPFLLRLQPALRITPIVVSCRPEHLQDAGIALARTLHEIGEDAAMIVSSDMNHYADKDSTLKLDSFALRPFLSLEPENLLNTVVSRRISMCGVLPATLGLFACQKLGASKAELVCHTTSADAFGDTARTVGYAGAYIL